MPAVLRLDFPIRLAPDGKALATVEQDTVADWAAGVEMAVRTHLGEFTASPEFGTEDWSFREQPIGAEQVREMILRSEPRAQLLVQEAPDLFDALVDRLTIVVSGAQNG